MDNINCQPWENLKLEWVLAQSDMKKYWVLINTLSFFDKEFTQDNYTYYFIHNKNQDELFYKKFWSENLSLGYRYEVAQIVHNSYDSVFYNVYYTRKMKMDGINQIFDNNLMCSINSPNFPYVRFTQNFLDVLKYGQDEYYELFLDKLSN